MSAESRPGLAKANLPHPAQAPELVQPGVKPSPPPPLAEIPPAREATDYTPEVTFAYRGPAALRKRLRAYALEIGRPAQEVVMDALREYLDQHEGDRVP